MLGHTRLFRRPLPVVLEERVTIGARLTHFLRAIVSTRDDGAVSGTAHRSAGLRHPDVDVTRQRAARRSRGSARRRTRARRLHALPLGDDASLTTQFAL